MFGFYFTLAMNFQKILLLLQCLKALSPEQSQAQNKTNKSYKRCWKKNFSSSPGALRDTYHHQKKKKKFLRSFRYFQHSEEKIQCTEVRLSVKHAVKCLYLHFILESVCVKSLGEVVPKSVFQGESGNVQIIINLIFLSQNCTAINNNSVSLKG